MPDEVKPQAQPKKDEPKPPQPAKPAAKGTPPALDERRWKYEELAAHRGAFEVGELLAHLRDGRAVVRANAALALAVAGQPALELVTQLRDSDAGAGQAAAESLHKLGGSVRGLVQSIVQACGTTSPEVTDEVVALLADLSGTADDELIAALDIPLEIAMRSLIAACGKLGRTGVALLAKGTRHDTIRVRVNACAGLGKLGKTDADTAMAALTVLEANDPVPDVRTSAKHAMLAVVAREKVVAVDHLPKNIPDFENRKLSMSELGEYDAQIDLDEMIYALHDGRNHVRINAARALAVKGDKAARAASAMGLLMRDSAAQVRREVAKALGKLRGGAVAAAPDLVGALGDPEVEVAEAAADTLGALGDAAQDALVKGLETGSEEGGRRVGELLSRLPGGPAALAEAFKSPAVNVQVNAALGLGLCGKARVGAGLPLLLGARTGGDARTRDAVRRALDMIDPRGDTGPKPVPVDGFETRALTGAELDKAKAELAAIGVGDFILYLQDGRDVVRGNAAGALATFGAAAIGAARSLGVRLRDDSARVRLAAAQALDKIGDAAVLETADDLVGALGDVDAKVADTCGNVIRARKARMIGALVRGLETDKPEHGKRIVELLNVFDDAVDILCDAFESPAVNVQVNAALGLALLGPKRVGKGRKALEGARTGGWERTRIAVRAALDLLDGPRRTGPGPVAVEGFETRVLEAAAFGDGAKLVVEDLLAYCQDGRAVVRANAATALGCCGERARGAALALGVLMRDDDMRTRIQAAAALDKLGDDAVRETADYLVGALRGDADVAKAVAPVLAARKARVLTALLKGLETDDDVHARRILELIKALPDACEILCDAIESPAENVQVNSAIGIGMLGAKRAGAQGRKALEERRTGGFVRTREAAFKGLAMLDAG
ncbi:MAG TPA: HEAT repeat domain-containing protein [Kofleriaceae bacterium]|nr:HEAT repeat domain-containing protein [Kofleriaceae bacterium]